ncbi:MAG TPA: choice-of-anchor Q domain-containing protein [Candidatus Polarisedimenticolia bacterium]|nr:choice-of-anchor Q domain-containing protein [Candidatus Polarisedimenticolia bacterium]
MIRPKDIPCTQSPCDDFNACTHSDTCVGGVCTGTSYSCQDGNVCTTDACDGAGGCNFTNNTVGCDDGNACTVFDRCSGGACQGSPASCDDGNACTLDSCDALKGCVHAVATAPGPATGRTITVDDDGSALFRSIQTAIDDPGTAAGDVVSVAPGTYFENLLVKCGVSVVGAGYETTIVDGGGRGAVARIADCCSDTRLQGFTLTNGLVSGEYGAGVRVVGGAPIITFNLITGNRAEATFGAGYYSYCYGFNPGAGGGVALVNSQATLSQNRITNNSSQPEGGGMWVFRGSPVITRNFITGNQAVAAASYGGCYAPDSAGGVSVLDSSATVSENVIADNTARDGGGLGIAGGSPLVTRNEISGNEARHLGGGIDVNSDAMVANNLILGNSAFWGGGVASSSGDRSSISNNTIAGNLAGNVGGGVLLDGSQATLVNNVLYGNQGSGITVEQPPAEIASNIFFRNSPDACQGSASLLCSGSGNLAADPLLVNPSKGDYRLGSGSPAIDSGRAEGAPTVDFRGQWRPLDGDLDGVSGVDRGAYEYDRDDVLGLRFVNDTLLNWDAAPGATTYHVYSGFLATLLRAGLDTCRDGEDADLSDLAFTETRIPTAGEGLAYVVTAVVGGVEGSPGWNSLGLERPQSIHCP